MRLSGAVGVVLIALWSHNAFGQPAPLSSAPPAASVPEAALPPPPPIVPPPPGSSAPAEPARAPSGAQAPDNAAGQLLAWQRAYVTARERLVAGDFPTATALFRSLASTAPNHAYHTLALEQWRLASQWASRGLVLVQRSDLGESAIAAKAADERTSDELAVLYVNSVFYGLGTGGYVAVLSEPNSAAGVILPALFLGGAAAGGVALLDSGRPLRYGVPQAMVTGMYLGLEEGILWSFWNQARVKHSAEWEPKTVASVIWGFTTAGAAAGGIIGQTAGTTPGRASLVGSAALWSAAVVGMGAGAVLDPDSPSADDHALLAAALGLNAGAVAGMLAAGPVSPTVARMRYVDLGGIAGGLVFGGLYLAMADEDVNGQTLLGLTALGIGGGLATSWFLTSNMPKDSRANQPEAASSSMSWSPRIVPTQHGVQLGAGGFF